MKITKIALKNIGKTARFKTTLADGCNVLSANKDVFNALCYFAQSWTNRLYAREFLQSFSEKSAFELELADGDNAFYVAYAMREGNIVSSVCLNGTQLPRDSEELAYAFDEYLFPHENAQYSFFDGTIDFDYVQKRQNLYLQAVLDDVREMLTSRGRIPTEEELLGFASTELPDGKSSYAMYKFIKQYLHTAQPVLFTTESGSASFDGAKFAVNDEVLNLDEPWNRALLPQADEQLVRFCFANRMFRAECREKGFRSNFPVVMWNLTHRQAQAVQNNVNDVQLLLFTSSE